jgi:hypothetical protein
MDSIYLEGGKSFWINFSAWKKEIQVVKNFIKADLEFKKLPLLAGHGNLRRDSKKGI